MHPGKKLSNFAFNVSALLLKGAITFATDWIDLNYRNTLKGDLRYLIVTFRCFTQTGMLPCTHFISCQFRF